MKLARLTLAATAAAFLMTAGLAGACGSKAKAQVAEKGAQVQEAKVAQASLTTKSGCSKSKAAHAAKIAQASAEKSGCSKSKAAHAAKVAQASNGKSGCCAKAKAALASNDGSGCSKAKARLASAGHPGCSKAAKAQLASCSKKGICRDLPSGRVKLEGTVACAHCDLGVSDSCLKVLKTAHGCAVPLADTRRTAALVETAGDGTKVVRVHARVDDEGTVAVRRYRVIGDAPVEQAAVPVSGETAGL